MHDLFIHRLVIYTCLHRTQKAEIEALQATIAANKAAHDAAAKKWKVTENRYVFFVVDRGLCLVYSHDTACLHRLYSLIHEHSDHIENLEKQVHSKTWMILFHQCAQLMCPLLPLS